MRKASLIPIPQPLHVWRVAEYEAIFLQQVTDCRNWILVPTHVLSNKKYWWDIFCLFSS